MNQAILPTILVVGSSIGFATTITVMTVAIAAIVMIVILFLSREHEDFGIQVIHAGNKINNIKDIPTTNIFR